MWEVDAPIAASQLALLGSTGSPVIAVFRMLSLGKTRHVVPGRIIPADFTDGEALAMVPAPTAIVTQRVAIAATSRVETENGEVLPDDASCRVLVGDRVGMDTASAALRPY
jgi:hypothetical protein